MPRLAFVLFAPTARPKQQATAHQLRARPLGLALADEQGASNADDSRKATGYGAVIIRQDSFTRPAAIPPQKLRAVVPSPRSTNDLREK